MRKEALEKKALAKKKKDALGLNSNVPEKQTLKMRRVCVKRKLEVILNT